MFAALFSLARVAVTHLLEYITSYAHQKSTLQDLEGLFLSHIDKVLCRLYHLVTIFKFIRKVG